MKTSLENTKVSAIGQLLTRSQADFYMSYPGDPTRRQPVHTVYGGAQLFSSETPTKVGNLALKAFTENVPDPGSLATIFGMDRDVAQNVYPRLAAKLQREAVEDYRIDFEDGYGNRSDAEEDKHAESAALETAKAMKAGKFFPYSGIRIKAFTEELFPRAVRTLDIFLTTLLEQTQGRLPDNFVVTLPKVVTTEQVSSLVQILSHFEMQALLPAGVLRLELMIETPQSLFNRAGQAALLALVKAAESRCTAVHFGAYDYTAALNIAASEQALDHPACDFARQMMQNTLAGTGIFIADGATVQMPIGTKDIVVKSWQRSYRNVRHGLRQGYYQGWDLHPAQIPARYAALYAFFREGLPEASARLESFVKKAAQANLVGDTFDDAATGQGLLNFFLRGIACGALDESESEKTGLSLDEIRSRSFLRILNSRKNRAAELI